MFVPLSVLEFRDRAAAYFGDKIGVVDGDTALTYRAWAGRTHQLANALVDLGVGPGDRVSFITYNTHHLLEGYYGVPEAVRSSTRSTSASRRTRSRTSWRTPAPGWSSSSGTSRRSSRRSSRS